MNVRSGLNEGVPYSLSRWTDIPAAKWEWLTNSLKVGKMQAFDARVGIPDWWSLRPEDTHSLVFWTKFPKNMVTGYEILRPYNVKAHVTITGWSEVEHAVPNPQVVTDWTRSLSSLIGKENLTWRFSPVPLLESDALYQRFEYIAARMRGYTTEVFLSFLQPNDLINETRGLATQLTIMENLASIAEGAGIRVKLCNDNKIDTGSRHPNLASGVCVPCEGEKMPQAEACGCAIMVDPFTMNESCVFGCEFCYVADKSLAAKKVNTTKRLKVIQ